MEIIKVTLDTVTDVVSDIIKNQKEAFVYCVADESCAVIGSNGGADVTKIENIGIRKVGINHEGGTIILSPGDVEVGIFTKGYVGNKYRDSIVSEILSVLKQNGFEAVVSGNDILVNDKKVVGFGSRMFGNILYTAIQISVGINLDLIKVLCTKPMIKQPDGLKNYGVKTQDVLNIIFKTYETLLA